MNEETGILKTLGKDGSPTDLSKTDPKMVGLWTIKFEEELQEAGKRMNKTVDDECDKLGIVHKNGHYDINIQGEEIKNMDIKEKYKKLVHESILNFEEKNGIKGNSLKTNISKHVKDNYIALSVLSELKAHLRAKAQLNEVETKLLNRVNLALAMK